jgi:hypothetical protein
MKKETRLYLLLARMNANTLQQAGSPGMVKLTDEISSLVRGGLNNGCGEELPNGSCANSFCNNSQCGSTTNPTNISCTNSSCTIAGMSNTTCLNYVCF